MNSLKMPLHEAIDRLTILMLKRNRLNNKKDRHVVEKEYIFYKKVVESYRNDSNIHFNDKWIRDLKKINSLCWDAEAFIRLGRKKNFELEKIGNRMLQLRNLNKIRIDLKNKIINETGFGFNNINNKKNTALKTPLPEAIEKIGILSLKISGSTNSKEHLALKKELYFYKNVIKAYLQDGIKIKNKWIEELKNINRKSWIMEADITQGRESVLGLKEVGRRSILLRDMNKKRVALKKKIALSIGQDFYEIKTETT